MDAVQFYRVGTWCYKHRIPLVPSLSKFLIDFLFNGVVPNQAKIANGVKLGYGGMGVVIHTNTVIGSGTFVGQQVTIGSRAAYFSKTAQPDIPRIGKNVYIGAGAKVLGDIKIGDHAIIGANSVVLKDVPAKAIVAGIPARIIRYQDDIIERVPRPKSGAAKTP